MQNAHFFSHIKQQVNKGEEKKFTLYAHNAENINDMVKTPTYV